MAPKYYEAHEGAYQRLKAQGVDCWGKEDFEDPYMLPFLQQALKRVGLEEGEGLSALVVGCGTGPLACQLARRGFKVHGFDISQTAIEMANANAQARGLDIQYWVGDLCADDLGEARFDVIVDSHCMHCIVPDGDRAAALKSIRRALTDAGVFVLETMMQDPTQQRAGIKVDHDGIVWTPYPGDDRPDHEPASLHDGVWHVPQRRLKPNRQAMNDELASCGFEVLWSHTHHNTQEEAAQGSGDYQGICRRK